MCVREFLARSPVQIAFDIGIFFKGLDGVLEIVGSCYSWSGQARSR